jgi:hypothetical protein
MVQADLKLRWMSRRSGDVQEAPRQIPALAKLEKAPKMKAVWKQGSTSRDWSAAYRGLTIRIKVDPETGTPTEICWYVGGVLSEIAPVNCSLSVAQKIGVKIVDVQIENNPQWAHAEQRWQRGLFLRR